MQGSFDDIIFPGSTLTPALSILGARPPDDHWDEVGHCVALNNEVNCSLFKADIEGVPEVSLNLSSKPSIHIAFHPCFQWVDITSSGRSGSLGNSSPDFYQAVEQVPVSRSVCFTPPHDVFPLCHMNGDSQLPVKGVYQLKTEVGHLNLTE